MLNLSPIQTALRAQETDIATPYGRFEARLWYATSLGWLAHVRFRLGEDVTIHRTIPIPMSEVDAVAWIEQTFADGPRFVLTLLETIP